MAGLKIIDPVSYEGWDELIGRAPGCPVFHSSQWARILQESYGFTPRYAVGFEDGRPQFCLPLMEIKGPLGKKKAVSLPFSDNCEPCASTREHFNEFFGAVAAYGRQQGWNSIELRGGSRFLPEAPPLRCYYGHSLMLCGGEEELFRRLRDSTRRNILKARRCGVAVSIETSLTAVKSYYRLHCISRRSHGLPPQPFGFFEKIHRYLIGPGRGFVALGHYGREVAAGALFFSDGGAALYKFGASEKAALHVRVNNLVMWEAIRHVAAQGRSHLYFGRTDIGHEGLRQFKNGWGAVEEEIRYYRWDVRAGEFISAKPLRTHPGAGVFRVLPIALLRWVGALAYKYAA